jgi:hypothetical protein
MIAEIPEDYRRRDRERGQALLDAFAAAVNADHDDVICIARHQACFMRDEIERLRQVEASSWGVSCQS